MTTTNPADLHPCPDFRGWSVPDGFTTFELVQVLGVHEYRYGVAHVYDDGELRIVVRSGNRESYDASGYYMTIESLIGDPGQHFPNVESALAEGRRVAREHERLMYVREQRGTRWTVSLGGHVPTFEVIESEHGHTCDECRRAAESATSHAAVTGSTGATYTIERVEAGSRIEHSAKVQRVAD